MLKKSTKKQSKMIDNEKEPELINKISPRRKEQFENQSHSRENSNPSSQRGSIDNIANSIQGKNNNSQNRNNLEEIVKILQKPIVFQINYNNSNSNNNINNLSSNSNSKAGNSQSRGQSAKNSQQISLQHSLNGNNQKISLFSNIQAGNTSSNNSNNNSNNNNTQVIAEQDISKYIENCIEQGLKYLDCNQLKDAIQQFRNAEVVIDTYMQSEGKVSTDLMLAVVINLGICFYKAGLFDEAYSCFENSDMRMKKKIAEKASAGKNKSNDTKYSASASKDSNSNGNSSNNNNNNNKNQLDNDSNGSSMASTIGGCISEAAFVSSLQKRVREGMQENGGLAQCGIDDGLKYFNNLGNKLKRKRLRLSLNLQMCILFSEIGKHEDALDYAKKSSRLSIHILYDCLSICYFILLRATLNSNHNATQLNSTNNTNSLTLSQKLILETELLSQPKNPINNSIQSSSNQLQNTTNQSNRILNNSHRRIRSEYGSSQSQQNSQASNKVNTSLSQQNNRNSSCDSNSSPVVKQRSCSGNSKGRILTPTLNSVLEKKLSSSSAYSNSNSQNNIHINTSNSTSSLNNFKQYSKYGNLLSENSSDSPSFTQEDVDLALKCLPVFNYIINNFQSLRENFNEKVERKVKLTHYLRYLYEDLVCSKELDPKKKLNFILAPTQLDMYFINSQVKENHWLLTSNILNLLQMKPVPLSTISSVTKVENEVSIDGTLKKLVETAICFYCISTETRFIEESSFLQNPNLSYKVSDSEFWLGKSLEIAYALIPQDAPMISQIINVYTRFHGVDKQIIPEEEEFPDQVKLLKPQKGVNITNQSNLALKNNFFIPAIRTIIPKIHAQNPSIYYHSQPHLQENLDLYTSQNKNEQVIAEEAAEMVQKHFQKESMTQNQGNKIQTIYENNSSKKINKDQNEQNNQVTSQPSLLQSTAPQASQNNKGEESQQDTSNSTSILTQTQLTQIANSIGTSINQKKSNLNSSTQSNASQQTQQINFINQPNKINEIEQINNPQLPLQDTITYLQTKVIEKNNHSNNNNNNNKSSIESLQYFTQQIQKSQQIQLKSEEQYLNQQKYQQGQFLGEILKARSQSREKKQTSANNTVFISQQPGSNNNSSNIQTKDQQQILQKIEQIVKKQRPQSSSVHSSNSTQQQQYINSINNNLNQSNNIFNTSPNIKKSTFSNLQSQQQQNQISSYNNNQQQSAINQINQLFTSDQSNQICYSEPSNSSHTNNNRFKIQNNNNGIENNRQGRNNHNSPQQSNVNPQIPNNNPQQMFTLQQQLIANAKIKKSTPQQNQNQLQINSTNNQNANNPQQKPQGHNFLKSFNQFLKQNCLQDDKKQQEPKKPSSANQNQQSSNQTQQTVINQNQQSLNQNNPNQFSSHNNQQISNSSHGPITSEILATKKTMKQNFFDNHRPSLPEQFGLSQINQEVQNSQSTKNSSNYNSNNLTSSQNNQNIQKSFNYEILKQQLLQQSNNTPQYINNNVNKNNGQYLNNENLMPSRHQSEPHTNLKGNTSSQGDQQKGSSNKGNSNYNDNNYILSSLLNQGIRQHSQEKEQGNKIREKKLNSFKQGDIQINTNFIYLPTSSISGSQSTAAQTCTNSITFTEPSTQQSSTLPQETFLRQLELNNYSLKHQQKRNFSASNKNTSSSTSTTANNNNNFIQSKQNQEQNDGQLLINNYLNNNQNSQTAQMQNQSISNSQQFQQGLLSSYVQGQQNKQQTFAFPQQNISSTIQNNVQQQIRAQSDLKTQKVNSRQLHKRKMVSSNIQFNEKFNLVNVKSPTNYSSIQSPSNNFTSIPSTTKSNFAKISIPGSTSLQTKIIFPQTNQQINQSNPSNTSSTQQQQRKESAHRKRRIKTDSYDAGAFNSFEIDNKLRNSFEHAHINAQNSRMKTQN